MAKHRVFGTVDLIVIVEGAKMQLLIFNYEHGTGAGVEWKGAVVVVVIAAAAAAARGAEQSLNTNNQRR